MAASDSWMTLLQSSASPGPSPRHIVPHLQELLKSLGVESRGSTPNHCSRLVNRVSRGIPIKHEANLSPSPLYQLPRAITCNFNRAQANSNPEHRFGQVLPHAPSCITSCRHLGHPQLDERSFPHQGLRRPRIAPFWSYPSDGCGLLCLSGSIDDESANRARRDRVTNALSATRVSGLAPRRARGPQCPPLLHVRQGVRRPTQVYPVALEASETRRADSQLCREDHGRRAGPRGEEGVERREGRQRRG